jgi:hypothetical protein
VQGGQKVSDEGRYSCQTLCKTYQITGIYQLSEDHQNRHCSWDPTETKSINGRWFVCLLQEENSLTVLRRLAQKKRGILDMKETQVPLIVWLGQQEFREKYTAKSGGIQLLFY